MPSVGKKGKYISRKSISEIYIERNDSEAKFFNELADIQEEIDSEISETKCHVINYYGLGGIGKTSIKNHLTDRIDRKRWITLDFEDQVYTERDILENFLEKMNQIGINDFYCTTSAIIKLCEKEGKPFTGTVTTNLEDIGKTKTAQILSLVVEKIPTIGSLIGTAKELIRILNDPDDRSVNEMLSILSNKAKGIDNDSFICVEDIRQKNYSKEELKSRLFEYLSLDLRIIMENRKEPLIVFIDTYEKYINPFTKDKICLSNDEAWLRKLIYEVPYILWVISGRESLGKIDEENWIKIVPSPDEIKCFTEVEIKRYMTNLDVDLTLLPLFSRLSEGIPYYLELLCKSYAQNKVEGGNETALDESKYGLNKADIADRYLKRFSDGTKDLLKQLVIIKGGWNDDMLNAGVIKDFDKTTHSKLIESSLVKYNRDTQKYNMPEPIRKVLLEFVDTEIIEDVRKRLSEYFLEIIIKENTSDGIRNIEQFLNYSTTEEKESIFSDIIIPRIASYFKCYKMDEVKILLEKYREVFNESDNNTFKANYLEMEGLLYKNKRDYINALKKHEECYQLRKEELGEEHHATLCSLSNIASCLDNLGEYKKAIEICQKCLQLRTDNPLEDPYEKLVALNNNASVLANSGKYDEAMKKYEACYLLEKMWFLKNNEVVCSTLQGIAFCYERRSKYDKALEWYNMCYEAVQEVYSERHSMSLLTLNGIACCYLGLNDPYKALTIFEKCYEIQKEDIGENHSDTLATLVNIANCYEKCGLIDSALDIYLDCYKLQRERLGEWHIETLNSLTNIGLMYKKSGQTTKALETFEKCYELQSKYLGKDYPDTVFSLKEIICLLEMQGLYGKALEKCYELYDIHISLFQKNHSEILATIRSINFYLLHLKS